jgi:uncharacterized RDD family membrane protein YckC
MDWFYAQGGQQVGPVTESRLTELAHSGDVSPDTLVWHSGMAEWQPYRAVSTTFAPPIPGDPLRYCNSCGNQFPASDLAMFGESAVCAACKPDYVQRLRQGMTTTSAPHRFEYAGFWIRFVAYLIDGIILGCARYAITIPLGLETFFRRGGPTGLSVFFSIAQLVGSIMGIAYYTYFWTQHNATPGKMIFGLKVVRPDGGTISIGQSIGRYFCYILDTITIFIGFMMAGWDDEKRALHDRLCDTRVIRTR